jgi:hypothetical protein
MLSLWDYVRIRKIEAAANPELSTAGDFDPAQSWTNREKAPPKNYTVEGYIARLPKVGEPLYVLRTNRNGVNTTGYFNTSIVVSIIEEIDGKKSLINTKNSIYQIEILPKPEKALEKILASKSLVSF